MRSLHNLPFLLAASLAFADSTFKSRPDLAPPTLNITIPYISPSDEGYLFVAPFCGFPNCYNRGPAQAAPYILTDTGDLVWSGFAYFSIWAANFQAARWKGQDVLFSFEGSHNGPHGHGHGHHTILDNRYENIREIRAGGHLISDKHEFIIINESSALIQIYHPTQQDLRPYGGNGKQTWIVDAIFQELDIETGAVLFEWHSLDHVSPDETKLPLPLGQAGIAYNSSTAWDYFHINSITKADDGNYLLSARHASTIFKINGTDGSVIWRLGGKRSNFVLGPEVEFGFQHHARYLPGGNETVDLISLFDNSVYCSESADEDKEVRIYPYSRGKYIAIDHISKIATLVKAFHPPDNNILTKSQGSLQTLPSGNVLINWGSEGQITEYTPDGTPIFHAHLDSGLLGINVQNYRAFRYPWTGSSPETPAVYAEKDDRDSTLSVYVSWNGDTRTKLWRFTLIRTNDFGNQAVIQKDAPRRGFETALKIALEPNKASQYSVSAEAIDERGRAIGRTDFVIARSPLSEVESGRAAFIPDGQIVVTTSDLR
ncbi:hypothetical protein GQ53DRAFT_712559 [Thozetella sp. PMI_491]|nr:hypothetical protein GQ53DRAFT_712559 [Thozetella sp. PMI_491]